MKAKFLTAAALCLALMNCSTGEPQNRITVAGNVSIPTPSKVVGSYDPIRLTPQVLEKFEVEVEAPENPCERDLDSDSLVNATVASDTVTSLRLTNFLDYNGSFTNLSIPNPNDALVNSDVFSQTYAGLGGASADCTGQIKQFGNFVNIILSCRVEEPNRPVDVCSVGMAREVETPAAPGNLSAVSGLYSSIAGNTCYDPDSGDTDGLKLVVNGSSVTYFGLDDDFTEVVQSFSNNQLRYSFREEPSLSCNVTFSATGATGSCSFNNQTCNLRYTKCSNDPEDNNCESDE